MHVKHLTLIIGSALALLISGGACSLKSQSPSTSISIQIRGHDSSASFLPSHFHSMSAPTLISDFDCYVVNVTGPGIESNFTQQTGCPSTDHVHGTGFGAFSTAVRAGHSIELSVPIGPARQIDVYGIYPSPPECAGTLNAGSQAYFVGGTNLNLAGDMTVSIPVLFTSGSSASFACTAWGTAAAVAAPTALTTSSATDTQIAIGWTDNATDETGYEVETCSGTACTGFAPAPGSPLALNTTSYNATSLSHSSIYRLRVRAARSGTFSTWLTSGDLGTGPVAPSALVPTSPDSASVNLSWTDNSADETGFQIESCAGAGCTTFTPISGSPFAANTTSQVVSGLTANSIYRFRVRSVIATGTSAWLTSGNVNTLPIVAAPTAIATNAVSDTSITVGWTDNATDETSYEVESCSGASCTSFSPISGSPFAVNTVTATRTGLTGSTIYRLRTRAVRGTEPSTWLTTADITTAPPAPTTLVTNLVTDTQATVGWTDNSSDETAFEVEQCTGSGCTSFSPATGSPLAANTVTYTASSLSSSTIYRLRIRAARTGVFSGWLTSGDLTTGPTAPSTLAATAPSSDSVNMTWADNSSNETGFQVQSCVGAGCTSFADVSGSPFPPNTTTHLVTGLTPTTTYRVRVRSLTAAGSSAWLTSGNVTTLPIVVPPTALASFGITGSQIQWSWTDNATDETSYEVESCTGTSCTSYSAIAGSPFGVNTTTATLTGLNPSTVYRLRTRAVRGPEPSTWLTSSDVATAPATPSALSPTGIHTLFITLSWTDNATDETSYEVESCTGSSCSSFAPVNGSPFAANTTTATINALVPSTTYGFRVRAMRSGVPSGWVPTGDVTTLPYLYYAYTPSSGGDSIDGFSVNTSTGALNAVPGSPFTCVGSPTRLITHPTRPFLYSVNASGNDVCGFNINPSNGALTPISGSPFAAGTYPDGGFIHPGSTGAPGGFLYVANSSSDDLSSYAINPSTGALMPITTTTLPGGTGPEGVYVHPGNYLYYCGSSNGKVGGFSVNPSTGALTSLGAPAFYGGSGCNAITGIGNLMLIPDFGSYDVTSLVVTPGTGAWSANSPTSAGTNTADVSITPNGSYTYAVDNSGSVFAFGLNTTTGIMTPLSPSSYSAGTQPTGVVVGPTGTFLYTTDGDAGSMNNRRYSINPGTGALGFIGTTTLSAAPSSISIANVPQ